MHLSSSGPELDLSTGAIIGCSIATVFLVLLAFLASGGETALTSVRSYEWDACGIQKKHKHIYKMVHKLLANFPIALGAIIISNTLANIIASALVTLLIEDRFGNHWVTLATAILSIVVLVAGEFLPKSIGRRHGLKWLITLGWSIYAIYWVFFPFSYILNNIFNHQYRKKQKSASENDIKYLVDAVSKEGVLEHEEAHLTKKALQFDETTIESIMIKQVNIIPHNASLKEIREILIKTDNQRLPVINQQKDDIVGFVLVSESLRAILKDKIHFKLKDYLHKLWTAEPDTKLPATLRLMQRNNSHIVAIVNPSNHTKMLGIVTLEMIIEQLVGPIFDEEDEIKSVQKISDISWIVDPDIKAENFMMKYFNIKTSSTISISDYVKKQFRFTRPKPTTTYQNKIMKVHIVRNETNEIRFEITKII